LTILKSRNPRQTSKAGENLAAQLNPGDVIRLDGPLGSGKTHFTKGLAKGLGVKELVTSPTFALVQDYSGRIPLRHMDLYRIHGEEDFEALGGEELFWEEGITVIEWAERVEALLPLHHIQVEILMEEGNHRTLVITHKGKQGAHP